jgi:hypothetical protein
MQPARPVSHKNTRACATPHWQTTHVWLPHKSPLQTPQLQRSCCYHPHLPVAIRPPLHVVVHMPTWTFSCMRSCVAHNHATLLAACIAHPASFVGRAGCRHHSAAGTWLRIKVLCWHLSHATGQPRNPPPWPGCHPHAPAWTHASPVQRSAGTHTCTHAGNKDIMAPCDEV